MTDIFQTVLNMSITGAYIAAAIIVLRLCMKKLPRKYSYMLWSILGIRLLCPISFSFALSLFNLFKPAVKGGEMTYIPQNIGYMETPSVNVGVPFINDAVSGALPSAEVAASVNPMQLVLFVAAVIWLVGIAAMLTYSVISYIGVKKRVSASTLLRENVYLCGNIETPFVYGIIKPKIYIPLSAPEADLDYILAHERAHIRRGDHIVKLLALAALTLHWFNPLIWISFKLMTNDMELSCDEKALKGFKDNVKKDYASALLNISVKQNKLSYGGLLSFGESGIKSRIKGVLSSKKPTVIVTVAAIAAVVIAAVCLLTNAGQDNGVSLPIGLNDEYASYVLSIADEERILARAEIQPLLDKLGTVRGEPFEPSGISAPTPNYLEIYSQNGDITERITFMNAVTSDGGQVYYIALAKATSGTFYSVSESVWREIEKIFSDCYYQNSDGLQTALTSPAVTEKAPEPTQYDSETELCAEYITVYIRSLFANTEDRFYPDMYCSSDADMLNYASLVNQYDKNNFKIETLNSVTVKIDEAVITKSGSLAYVRLPYAVEYGNGESGFGKIAYFELENTEKGYKVYRALLFTPADVFATGLNENDVINAESPIEFNIKNAVAALATQESTNTETVTTNNTPTETPVADNAQPSDALINRNLSYEKIDYSGAYESKTALAAYPLEANYAIMKEAYGGSEIDRFIEDLGGDEIADLYYKAETIYGDLDSDMTDMFITSPFAEGAENLSAASHIDILPTGASNMSTYYATGISSESFYNTLLSVFSAEYTADLLARYSLLSYGGELYCPYASKGGDSTVIHTEFSVSEKTDGAITFSETRYCTEIGGSREYDPAKKDAYRQYSLFSSFVKTDGGWRVDSLRQAESVDLPALSLIGCYNDGNYRVGLNAWETSEDFELFRKYFFGTWDNAAAIFGEAFPLLTINDSESSFFMNQHSFGFNTFYAINENVLAFTLRGSAEARLFWLDVNAPDIMYSDSLSGDYLWEYTSSAEHREPTVLTKTAGAPSNRTDNFLSVFELRETAREYGIDYDMLTHIEWFSEAENVLLLHDDWAQLYPVYLISEEPDKLTLKTKVGNVYFRAVEGDVTYTLQKTGGQWTRTEEFGFTPTAMSYLIVASNAAEAFLKNDKDALSKYLLDPSYEALSENSRYLYDRLTSLTIKEPDLNAVESNVVYPADCSFTIEYDMVFYLDMGLISTENGWRVSYIGLQG